MASQEWRLIDGVESKWKVLIESDDKLWLATHDEKGYITLLISDAQDVRDIVGRYNAHDELVEVLELACETLRAQVREINIGVVARMEEVLGKVKGTTV